MKKSLITLSLLAALTAQAHDNHKHDEHYHDNEKVEHIGAHVHGVAQLNVVLDGEHLIVKLASPAMNVVGFEHKPETEAHLNQSHDALHKLKDGEWLAINGGGCELDDKDVDWQYKHILAEHFHADEKAEHKHEHKEEHKHGHDEHHHGEGETHSDIESEHEFDCKKPSDIKTISVNLFDDFKGFEKLNVQWIANDKQGATTLTKDNRVLEFK